eukprot:CAMPEP_0119215370 /NCGR_PEP_ID=MMETSP1327-20130426/12107_1 /TAXON_ID=38833 /ORGANISM="Micromonas pusilla, Strain RCC2306" /LENGTH=120 /DNA_ID=CAMNT_0007213181 /DNA_START=190 /DNA_END=552 /DNA_ORIENTATION=+
MGDGAISAVKSIPRTTSVDATATTSMSPQVLLVARPTDATGPHTAHPRVTACSQGFNSENETTPHALDIGPAPNKSGKCRAPPAAYRTAITLRNRPSASAESAGISDGSSARVRIGHRRV